VLLDSSALLAYLLEEPGGMRVNEALTDGAFISTVNLAEVISKLVDYGYPDDAIPVAIKNSNVEILPFAAEAAAQSGLLRRVTRSSGLSLGDRSCLAVAQSSGLAVLTCDRNWAGLDIGIEIELCR